MVNLIPPSAKKGVIVEYWLRVITVWALIATVVSLLFALTFLPVYVAVEFKIDAFQESAQKAADEIASFQQVSEELTRSTQQAQLVLASANEISMFAVIELFDQLETNGIEFSQITVSKVTPRTLAPVTMAGTARDRQALSDFRDRLLEQEVVEAVDFPLNNLAKDRDITFSITVTMSDNISL